RLAGRTIGSLRVGFGGLAVTLAAVIGEIEPAATEDQSCAGREQPLGVGAAFRATSHRRIGDPLELLEFMPRRATILVRWHGSSQSQKLQFTWRGFRPPLPGTRPMLAAARR